ncbi:MAG: RsmD family RNA methyltransferase [Myxococcota bacterium]|nr:RsmD family RNA methyltransferase [Myxococcota bacterium]
MRILRGIWAGEALTSPGKRVRPTQEPVRDAWMSYLAPEIERARIVDLFAGSGSLGLEALSRGAASVDFIDQSGEALHALKANVARRKLRPPKKGAPLEKGRRSARIFKRDVIPFIERLQAGAYDLAFADPPYGSRKLDRVLTRWQEIPFSPTLCIEHAPDHPVPAGAHQLRFESSFVTIYRV